ncbi:matrix extracellular phosphoglycoprotein [Sceloporus undulatus]|uniref:matrix extracellular phosphoglycoprotein n=1 Tax=Sceloporus undulatus TaxID=8520 RepID=UPI001C4C4E16|nr:matrix extracellular phosphoglycoprotein [Sceloporus undulatus]
MKAALLYLCLCSLVWAESELQPHYRKAKQKCVGEHQIMVKGRHSKHGFYIFNYVYSSSVPNNQTQIEKEENTKNISSATDGQESKPSKPTDKLIDHAQETRKGQKGKVNERKPEDRTTSEGRQSLNEHHGNPQNWDLHQHHLKVIVDKGRNEIDTEVTTTDIDGSGDEGLPGKGDTHHGLIVSKEPHEQGKDQHITRGTDSVKSERKDKDGKSGISTSTKPSKHGYIKIGVKGNDLSLSSVFQETNSDHYIPKKMKDPQSKDYSKVSLKGKTTPTIKKSDGKEGGSYINLLGKEGHVTATLNSHLSGQGNLARNIPGKAEHRNQSKYTSISDTDEIKRADEKGTHNTTEHVEGEYEATMVVRKQNEKDQSGVAKSHKREKVRGDIIISRVDVTDQVKLTKKDEAREDIFKGQSKSHMEAVSISKMPKKDDDYIGATEKFNSELEDPIFTKTDKINHSEIILDGFEIAQSHPKGDMTFHGRISGSQISGPHSTQEGTKGVSRVRSTRRKSSTLKEDFELSKPHRKEVGSHNKINRKGHESSLGDRETHEKGKIGFDVKLEEGIIKMNTSYNKAPAAAADIRQSSIYSSDRKASHQSQKSIRFKSAPSLSHGSHNNVQHPFNSPKHSSLKSREHSSTSVKSVKKVTKPIKETAKVNTGSYGSKIAKQYHGYSGTLRRKSSQRDRMHPSVKRGYKSDSSQSSESDENSLQDSRRSYEDYQNDQADSYQSAESAEEGLSLESNESDDQSQMENQKSSSQEHSQEHRSNA